LILGVSYLGNVGDTRYSPVEILYNKLIESFAIIQLHDPYIKFWEEVKIDVETEIESVINDNFDIIVFCTRHNIYLQDNKFNSWLSSLNNKIIFDTNLVLNTERIHLLKNNNVVKIIGNGIN
jgi:UDP-N-acetyl-D-mannosaminuronate dehydrogenase